MSQAWAATLTVRAGLRALRAAVLPKPGQVGMAGIAQISSFSSTAAQETAGREDAIKQ
jgi:hypothetical protein